MDFLTRPGSPPPQCLRPKHLLSKVPPRTMHIRGILPVRLPSQIDGALTCLSQRERMTSNHRAKRNDRAFKWFSKSPFMRCFPIGQEVLDISQITVTLQRTSPPFFIQAGLQQYCRRPFFSSAYRSFTNTIRLGQMVCRSSDDSMISLHRICQTPMNCQF